ncbi:MAG TPA: VTT domain-containing protein [Candidatus Omnitrophota bacterium]|nr:VTT domain-containing protein [Candidatus Omnitrophota bacterium]HPT07271.1 VTT domain-containing protein [Candidatus Omnitrophota bacterium]
MGDRSKNRFLLFILLIVVLWLTGFWFKPDLKPVVSWLRSVPAVYSVPAFLVVYVGSSFFFLLAKDLLWIVGAVLFDVAGSTVLICIGEYINAAILFNLSRFMGRGYVAGSLQGRYSAFDRSLSSCNFFWLFLVRATPVIPYRFLDLGVGLTGIPFPRYMLAVVLGTPLKTFWMQYILYKVGEGFYQDPGIFVKIFLQNKQLLLINFLYFLLMILVAVGISQKGRRHAG